MVFSHLQPLTSSFLGGCANFSHEVRALSHSQAQTSSSTTFKIVNGLSIDEISNSRLSASKFPRKESDYENLETLFCEFDNQLESLTRRKNISIPSVSPVLSPSVTRIRQPTSVRRKKRPPVSREGLEGQQLMEKTKRNPMISRSRKRQPQVALEKLKDCDSAGEAEKMLFPVTGKKQSKSEWEASARLKLKAMLSNSSVDSQAAPASPPRQLTHVPAANSSPIAKPLRVLKPIPTKSSIVDTPASASDGILLDAEGVDGAVIVASQEQLFDQLGFSKKERIVGRYILSLGFSETEFTKLADKRLQTFLTNLHAAKARITYLRSLGVEEKNVPKLILRHPQLLEYSIERTMQPRVDYLMSLGVCKTNLGRMITLVPTLLEYRIEECLKPRVKYLQDIVGISESDLPAVLQRSPQILTQSIENSLEPKLHFLQSLGIDLEDVARMVTRHPQLLHYSVNDNMKPRVEFLKSIGMSEPDIVRTLVRLSQILSLSVESNLLPKFEYLKEHLGGDANTVARFPAYFSLSLEQRIKPRHQFLASVNKLPAGAFPMKLLTIADPDFCKFVQCDEEEFYEYKNKMVLRSLTTKFGKAREKPKRRKTPVVKK